MHKIAIIDFGSQYAHLIARRIRNLNVYSEILDNNILLEKLKEYKGIILSGGPESVYEEGSPSLDKRIFELGLPILGICYGHQLITHLLGGTVEKGDFIGAEFGKAEMEILKPEGILKKFKKNEKTVVWMSHNDKVTKLADNFEILASSKDDPYSVVADLKKNFYGIQFHPEVVHSEKGMQILNNFIDLTGAKRDWNKQSFIEKIVEDIKKQVGDRNVFMLISGGVDSSVAYSLLVKALGQKRVIGYLIDTGLMRKNEAEEVKEMLENAGIAINVWDAKEYFLKALCHSCEGRNLKGHGDFAVTEPEQKRQIIGACFLEVQAEIAKSLNLNPENWLLGQGTIYPDTIESGGTKNSHKIKTHHNRVPEIEDLIKQGLLIEPIKDLYKDEVREVGLALGLPSKLISRHPFPGPGLGVRILCNSTVIPVQTGILKNSINFKNLNDEINNFLANTNFKAKVLPIKSVGVQGDFRTYKKPVVLIGDAKDFQKLAELSPAITNKFSEINRVLYLISPNNLNNALPVKGVLSSDRIQCLQEADSIAMKWLDKVDTSRQVYPPKPNEGRVWQMPVVLVPLAIDNPAFDLKDGFALIRGRKKFNQGNESIILRPVCSEEAMTANFAQLPMEQVRELAKEIMKDKEISAVFYDITNKPPATIEWE